MATALSSRLQRHAAPPVPDSVTLAQSYLESQGYSVRKRQDGYSFTGFLKAILERDDRTLEKVYGTGYATGKTAGIMKAAMGEESGSAGGYVVPQDFTYRLLEPLSEDTFIFPRANVIPMVSAETQCPKIDIESTPPAVGTTPFFGGVKFVWSSAKAATETEPTFRQESLKAWDLLGYAVVSNQWLVDAGPAGEEYLLKLFGKAAAWYAEYSFLQGAGAAQLMPLGILNSPGLVTVSRTTPNQIAAADIAKVAAKLLPFSWKNAIWATNPSTLAQIVTIGNFFLNVEAHEEGGQAGSLLTRPVFVTEKLAALGSAGDLLLFDPSLYVIGLRQEVLIDVSPHVSFPTNQTNFRIWMRLDGRPQVSKAITLQDGTTTVSPYVALV